MIKSIRQYFISQFLMSQQLSEVGAIISILEMITLRLREGKLFVQSPTAVDSHFNTDSLDPHLTVTIYSVTLK